MKSILKRVIHFNKYQSKVKTQNQNQYLNYLPDPSFQGVNRLFILTFNINANRLGQARYYLPTIKIKDSNVLIDRKRLF